jgi:hypothetical protein
MTSDEMIVQLQAEVKGLTSSLATADYTNAIAAAERDTGWDLPQTTNLKISWLLSRAKRHLFSYLMAESAAKFKFGDINLQQRFEHYRLLIKDMDMEFKAAQEEYAFEFAGVSASQIAGTKIDAGFQYEPQTGRETTYDSINTVIITPNENS